MKTYVYIAFVAVSMALASCGGNKGEIDKMQAKIDSLESINSGNTDNINGYIAEMNGIYDRLEEIKRNQGVISDNSGATEGDLSDDKRAKIQESINVIQALMDENKAKIDALNKKIKDSKSKNKQLEELIANLTQQLEEKDKEINSLKEQLATLNIQVEKLTASYDSLNAKNNENVTTIENQENEMNTVYYCMGTFKELTENKVLDKGGVFSAKSGSKLSADVNLDYFTKTDIRKITEIAIGAKKATLKTSHPSGSYTLVTENKKVTKLVINDGKKFWSNSKYCVIMLE